MAQNEIAAEGDVTQLTLCQYAYGFTPKPDERARFAAEFGRTCEMMARLRDDMPELEQVSAQEFMELVRGREPSQ